MTNEFKQNCVYDNWERMKLDMYLIRKYLESLPNFLPEGSEFYNNQVIELAKHWEIVADINTKPQCSTTSNNLILPALAGPCASLCFLTKGEKIPQTQAKQILPQTDAEQIPVVNTSVERADREIVCNFIAISLNATRHYGSKKFITGDIQTISGTMKCSAISARTKFITRYVVPIMGRQATYKIKKCINGGVSANEARVQVPTLYKAIRNNQPDSWTSLVAER